MFSSFNGSARAFATNVPGVPRRPWGWVRRDGNRTIFRWRPWLVLAERTTPLPDGASIGVGLVSPVLLGGSQANGLEIGRLPPRYRGSEAQISAALGGIPVVDVPMVRGLKAAIGWMRGAAVQAIGTASNRIR